MHRKITIIGAAGRSGADTIAEMARRNILHTGDELVLVDINERAKGLIGEAKTAFERSGALPDIRPVNALRAHDLSAIANSDIIVMCASVPFPKGGFRTRDWGLYKNYEINSIYAAAVKRHAPAAFVIMDTNPLDVLTARFRQESGLGEHQVIGKGADLDTQRLHSVMARHIAKKLQKPEVEIQAFQELQRSGDAVCMMGVHSSEHMLPVISPDVSILGRTVREWFTAEDLERVVEIAKEVGPKSSRQLETGSPSIGGAMVNCDLIEKLLSDKPSRALVSVPMRGVYDCKETAAYAATPAILSRKGIEQVLENPHVRDNPELMTKLGTGVRDVEDRLRKIPLFAKVRDRVGSMPQLVALVESDGRVIIAPRTAGAVKKDDLKSFFDDFRQLLLQPGKAHIEVLDDQQLRFYYMHTDEVAALLDTLHIEPVRDVMQEIDRTRSKLDELADLAYRLHPKGAEVLSWQTRTSKNPRTGTGLPGFDS